MTCVQAVDFREALALLICRNSSFGIYLLVKFTLTYRK
jgi:hypothetical protein